jgi:hypothetical protein
MSDPETFVPDREVGEQLRRFFIELLKDGNLREFQSRSLRNAYIDDRRADREGGYLSDRAAELLASPLLKEIEAHIAEIEGSGRATLQYTVCPPM